MIMHNGEEPNHSATFPLKLNDSNNNSTDIDQITRLANQYYQADLNPDTLKKSYNLNCITHQNYGFANCAECKEREDYYFLKNVLRNPSTYIPNPSHWSSNIDEQIIRKDFPILHRKVNGKSLIWLDNGATTQKPLEVINTLEQYYRQYNSNIHRGAHTLANYATNAYEGAREKVRNFIGATLTEEIIFTRGTTEAINLIAESYGGMNIVEGDEILLSMMEHHANIVPWQKLEQEKGAVIKVIPINENGEILLEEYNKLLTPRTKIVGITHVSNVLGTINPVKTMIEMAHGYGACVIVDGAQSIPHLAIDVKEMDADFYVFSGHKMYGPTGIGILYGKKSILDLMPPWQRGGGMIQHVTFNHTTYNPIPSKFEAGTGNIADAIALGAAVDYLRKIGMPYIEEHEQMLTSYAMERLREIPNLHLIGTSPMKTSVLSFVVDGINSESIGQYLDQEGIAVRSGHHCAQPVLRRYGLDSCVRASLGIYNTKEEVDCLANTVLKIAKLYN
jgi:cysteine desulfurase/selenocysteine lyase